MISKYKYKGLLWIDLQSPRAEEAESILEEFELPDSLKDKICKPHNASMTSPELDFTHSVLLFPKLDTNTNKFTNQEIGFIIGKNFLITTHYEFIKVLDDFAKKFEAEELLEANVRLTNSASLFYYLIQILTDSIVDQVSYTPAVAQKPSTKSSSSMPLIFVTITILVVIGIIFYLK